MWLSLEETLRDLIKGLSEENYTETFAQYRFWLDIGIAHTDTNAQDQVNDAIQRLTGPDSSMRFTHTTARLLVRFIGDIEADRKISRHVPGLRDKRCASALRSFFLLNLYLVRSGDRWAEHESLLIEANLIAQWANLGYVEEETIRNHILQSLISHSKLYCHQAGALLILLESAGATFEAYAGPSVIDRCFEFLKDYYRRNIIITERLEVIGLRKRGWEGLPPPPVFTARKVGPVDANRKDPAATPVMSSLGITNRDPEPQFPQPPPPEPIVTPEADTVPGSLILQSPSVSIATLSDFTIADNSDDEPSLDHTAITPHDTFYLEDGNIEVLCGNTLFRIHTTVLSFHSPVLGQMFAKANLATAESPNGCPRVPSSDTVTDFATLLKIIYLPVFPERNKVPDFATFSSLLRITEKYEMPAVRAQLLDIVRDAYPETFEGLGPSKTLGEGIFSGPIPHPNAVLNLFVQQKLTSALPMAYYMAARRGVDSLMDRRLPANARLSPEILQVTMKGLLALREMEFRETHRLIFGLGCSPQSICRLRDTPYPRVSEEHREVVDRIMDSTYSGTRLLQVLSLREACGGDSPAFCDGCVEGWEVGHADVRKNAWTALPDVFGLKS